MFIRFISGEVDPGVRVRTGLFRALDHVWWTKELPDYELAALKELEDWFDENLGLLPDYLSDDWRYCEAVCWFKSNASSYLSAAWEIVRILERNDVLVWAIKSRDVGDIYYEDEAQVFARPTRKVRKLLKR